jgi:hypothetical protein
MPQEFANPPPLVQSYALPRHAKKSFCRGDVEGFHLHFQSSQLSPSTTRHRASKQPSQHNNMPRQGRSGGGSRPSRPTVPSRAPAPQQTRPATTAAYPPARPNQAAPPAAAPTAPPATSQGPGLFGQMASTAAYLLLPPHQEHIY